MIAPRGGRAAAFLTGAALAACADGAPDDGAPGDGPPAGGDPQAPIEVSASAIEVLGRSDSLAQVRDLEVLEGGYVWVLNSGEPYFLGFEPDGDRLGSHGSQGGGPDEFRLPSAFVTGGWREEAWVFDIARHALIRISRPELEWAELSLPRESIPPGSVVPGMDMLDNAVRTARLGREIVVPRTNASREEGIPQFRISSLRPDLVAVDPKTGAVRTLVALGEVMDDPSADFVPVAGGFPLWFRLWSACGDDLVRVHDRVRNQLRGFDGSGTEVSPIDLPPVPFSEVSPRQFAAAVFGLRQAELTGDVATRLSAEDSLRLLDRMAQTVEGAPHELASYLPRYVDFRCGEDGTMWLQPLDLDAGGLGGGPLWLWITPDGTARAVRLPARFDALRFTGSRIWGVYRDELDVPAVASVPLPTP